MRHFLPVGSALVVIALFSAFHCEAADVPLLPGGAVFSEYARAAWSNPAALVPKPASLLQLGYAAPRTGSTAAASADFAASFSSFGIGAGVVRTSATDYSGASSRAVLGGAFQLDHVALGAAYATDVAGASATGSAGSSLNLGLLLGKGNGSRFALVLNGIDGTPTATVGVGHGDQGKYNLEANLQLPPFSSGSTTSTYTLVVSAAAYAGIFGLSFVSGYSYTTGLSEISGSPASSTVPATLAALVKLGKTAHFSVRTDSSSQLSLALAFGF